MQPTTVVWPDTIDEIFAGDCVVMLAYVTPASGVVLTPFTNFAVRDRAAGKLMSLNSSVGVWKKLERMRRNPRRLVVWSDLDCRGTPEVHGAPLPTEPPAPQRRPVGGTSPRINPRRAARRAARLSDVLLGWVGADGFPVVVPVRVEGADERGIVLDAPAEIVPGGGRRAGLTAHWFDRSFTGRAATGWGMTIRVHTGWLEATAGERRAVYAPHTKGGWAIPTSTLVYRLVAGLGTRFGLRGARREGFLAGAGTGKEDACQPSTA